MSGNTNLIWHGTYRMDMIDQNFYNQLYAYISMGRICIMDKNGNVMDTPTMYVDDFGAEITVEECDIHGD